MNIKSHKQNLAVMKTLMTLKDVKHHSRVKFLDHDTFGATTYIYQGMGWGCAARLLNVSSGEIKNYPANTHYQLCELIKENKLSDGQDAVLYRYDVVDYRVDEGLLYIHTKDKMIKINQLGYEVN